MTLRGLVYTLVFFLWTGFCCLILWPVLFSSQRRIFACAHWWVKSVDWLERHVLGLRYRIIGTLPKGPALIAMKHQSAWETMKIHILFEYPAIVLKKELLRIPIWGNFVKKVDMIPIDRAGGSKALSDMIAVAKRILAEQRPIIIFPQGTRVSPGDYRPYRFGIAKLYEKTGLPIIPVALNAGLFWPRHPFKKKPGEITVEILEPIMPGLSPKQALALLETQLETASNRLMQNP